MSSAPPSSPDLTRLLTSHQRYQLLETIAYILEQDRQRIQPSPSSHRTTALNAHDLFAEQTIRQLSALLSVSARSVPPTSAQNLSSLPAEKVLTALLSCFCAPSYDSRSRHLLSHLAGHLHLPISYLSYLERSLPPSGATSNLNPSPEASGSNSTSNGWKIGLSAVAGAVVIGATGGLAAPLVAGAFSTVGLGALSGLSGVATTAAFAGYGAKKSSEIAGRVVGDVEEFTITPLKPMKEGTPPAVRRRTAVGVSGWVRDDERIDEDTVNVWREIKVSGDEGVEFALRWETEILSDLGTAVQAMLNEAAVAVVGKEVLQRTILAGLAAAVMWPVALLRVARVVDNPFSLALSRGKKAGVMLAKALVEEKKKSANRPTTLVGFSMGAVVVFECLQELARSETGYGIVDDVVLLGAPIPAAESAWNRVRPVVAGRLVNVFSTKDWVLGFLYRASSARVGAAGLQAVKAHDVENVDVGDKVEGHTQYRKFVGEIVEQILSEDEAQREEVGSGKVVFMDNSKEKNQEDLLLLDLTGPPKERAAVKKQEDLLLLDLAEAPRKPMKTGSSHADLMTLLMDEKPSKPLKVAETNKSQPVNPKAEKIGEDFEFGPLSLMDDLGTNLPPKIESGVTKQPVLPPLEEKPLPLQKVEAKKVTEAQMPFMVQMVDTTEQAEMEDTAARIERQLEERRRRRMRGLAQK